MKHWENRKRLERIDFGTATGAGIEIRPMIAESIQFQLFPRKYVTDNHGLPRSDRIHDCSSCCGHCFELTRRDIEIIKSCIKACE